jgi:hypothetical protein
LVGSTGRQHWKKHQNLKFLLELLVKLHGPFQRFNVGSRIICCELSTYQWCYRKIANAILEGVRNARGRGRAYLAAWLVIF